MLVSVKFLKILLSNYLIGNYRNHRIAQTKLEASILRSDILVYALSDLRVNLRLRALLYVGTLLLLVQMHAGDN